MKSLWRNILITTSLLLTSTLSYANMDEIPELDAKKGSGLHGLVGIGAMSVPDYVGGSENEVHAIPLININYHDTYYIKFNRAGWWFWRPSHSNFRVGAELGFRQGWERDDLKESLDTMFDLSNPQYKKVDDSILYGLNAAFQAGRFSAEISLLNSSADENFYDQEPGTELVLRASYSIMATRNFNVTASTKVEALSEDTTDFLYGINGYAPDSAVNVSFAVIGSYKFSKNWLMLGGAGVNLLDDEIADSPIVEDDTQSMALLGVAYSF